MASQQEELIRNVFQELKGLGLIRPTHKLSREKRDTPDRYPNFYASKVCFRTIRYRFGNSVFDEDSLRFALLHEERHQRQVRDWYAYIFNMFVWGFVFIYLTWNRTFGLPWGCLSPLIVPAVWYGSWPFLRWGEMRSDLWASQQLKANLGVTRPSEAVRRALTWPPLKRGRAVKAIKYLLKLAHTDYHPSDENRIARIKRLVDDAH